MKKILWTLFVLIILCGLAFGAYWYFEQQQSGGGQGSTLSIGTLFPFGRGGDTVSGTTPPPVIATSTPREVAPTARLWKVYGSPQAGAGIFLRDGAAFVRFVDKATGNVFENKLGDAGAARITNTTIPKIHDALWSQKGDGVVLRYTSDGEAIQTLYGKMLGDTGPQSTSTVAVGQLDASFLASNIIDLAVFAPKDKIFYLAKNAAGNSVGFVANIDGTKSARLFESPVTEWSVAWPQENTALITTKPSAFSAGFSYFISTKTGAMQKLLGDIAGLSVLGAADATHVVYSASTNDGIALHSYNTKTGVDGSLVNTFAEKCVWSKDNLNVFCATPTTLPGGAYPDDWYKGKVSFADTFVELNTETNRGLSVLDPKTITPETLDAIHLALDPNEQFLVFTNKKDGALWALRLNNQ